MVQILPELSVRLVLDGMFAPFGDGTIGDPPLDELELLLDVLDPDELLELLPDELELLLVLDPDELELLLDKITPEELPDDDELLEEATPLDELLLLDDGAVIPLEELLLLDDGAVMPLEEVPLVDPLLDDELLDEELGVVGVTELGVTAALSVVPPLPPPPPHPAIANARVAVETYARIERIADLPPGRISVFYEPFAVLIQRSPLSR